MRNTEIRFSSTNEAPNSIRYPIHYIPFQNPNQNVYYPAPIALHLSSSQIPNGSHLNNNLLYQSIYQIGNQQLMLSTNPHLVISVPCTPTNISDSNHLTNQSNVDSHLSSSVTSPNNAVLNQSQNTINYSFCKWNEISPFYDGFDESRPSAGQLINGKYFTQRSAGKDIYMVFNSKADYINNFVNYYFSNKNLSTDEKLFNLMDDKGSVALSDLMKFPRLAQIGTTTENIVDALKFSQFVVIVNLKNDKGIRRSDGWFPSKLIDESQSINSQWPGTTSGSNGDSVNSASLQKPNSDTFRNTKSNSSIVAAVNNNISSYNQTNADSSLATVILQSKHHNNNNNNSINSNNNNNDIKSHNIDTVANNINNNNNNNNNNNSLVYFNSPNNNGIHHQPIQYAPTAFIHGLHSNNFNNLPSQVTAAPPQPNVAAPPPQLIINAPQHYSPTFFPQNAPIQLRPVWQGLNFTDVTRNNHRMLYGSSTTTNNTTGTTTNVRHVIGAGGNSQTNYKQCQY